MRTSRLMLSIGVLGLILACVAPVGVSAQTGCDAPYGAGCPGGPAPGGAPAGGAAGGGAGSGASGLVSEVAGGVPQAVAQPNRAAAPEPIADAPAAVDLAYTGSATGRQMRLAAAALLLGVVLVFLGRKPRLQVT